MKNLTCAKLGGLNNIIWAKYCRCFFAQNVQDLCDDENVGRQISQFFKEGRTSPKQCAQSGGLLWATENMQIQGPKTIGHMNTYISMLDFTSVPAWIILYCLTAGDCFSCLSANLFLSGILHCVFSGSRHGSFGAPYTWLPLLAKVC